MKKVVLFCALILVAMPAFSQQETLTITTYYPAPFGVYREMRMFKGDINTEIMLNNDGLGNPNIELRYLGNVIPAGRGMPYIDFSNDPASDFDYRMILIGNNDFRIHAAGATGVVTVSRTTGAGEVYAPLRAGELWLCGGNVANNP